MILYPPIVLLPSLGFHEEVVGWKSTHWPGIKVKEEDEELVVLVLWSSLRVRPVTVGESFLCDVMVARCHIMLMTWFHPVKDKALYLSYLEREKHAHDVLFWRLQAASCGLGCIDSLLVLLLSLLFALGALALAEAECRRQVIIANPIAFANPRKYHLSHTRSNHIRVLTKMISIVKRLALHYWLKYTYIIVTTTGS